MEPAIVSASRRTDIPAFYAEWFMNRIRAGYCTVPNPFDPNRIARVSLRPEDVAAIVFWTRHPQPLFSYLHELDQRGYRYYFHYTLMNNPRILDPRTPTLDTAVRTFRQLAMRVGPEKVIWRYDPIVLSNITDVPFHQENYAAIAQALRGYTYRSVISLLDIYRKLKKSLRSLAQQGVNVQTPEDPADPRLQELLPHLAETARRNGMEIFTCAEPLAPETYGIRPGKCIDDEYILRVFGIEVASKKDPSQRQHCRCVASRDIGMYDTCLFGCRYCYATSSSERARRNYEAHDPQSPSLVG